MSRCSEVARIKSHQGRLTSRQPMIWGQTIFLTYSLYYTHSMCNIIKHCKSILSSFLKMYGRPSRPDANPELAELLRDFSRMRIVVLWQAPSKLIVSFANFNDNKQGRHGKHGKHGSFRSVDAAYHRMVKAVTTRQANTRGLVARSHLLDLHTVKLVRRALAWFLYLDLDVVPPLRYQPHPVEAIRPPRSQGLAKPVVTTLAESVSQTFRKEF